MAIIKRKWNEMKFRWNVRKALLEASQEELDITKEELHREYQRRNKRKAGK